VRDVQDWLTKEHVPVAGGWTRDSIALELGAVLKAREQSGKLLPPVNHRSFSTLVFTKDGLQGSQLDEDDNGVSVAVDGNDGEIYGRREDAGGPEHGGWLEGDDIEDF